MCVSGGEKYPVGLHVDEGTRLYLLALYEAERTMPTALRLTERTRSSMRSLRRLDCGFEGSSSRRGEGP